MCLGVPGRVIEIQEEHGIAMGVVDFGGVRRRVCLAYVADETDPGDYVIVHVGFAIARIDEAEAARTMAILREMAELEELDRMLEAPDPRGTPGARHGPERTEPGVTSPAPEAAP